MTRRAKIVATLGPATSDQQRIRKIVDAGLDVARLNLSHGTRTSHESVLRRVRRAAEETGRAVGILADLQGPKIRLGPLACNPVTLDAGDGFTITTERVPGDRREMSTTYAGLPGDVASGDRILVDDGRVILEVEKSRGARVETRVVDGGVIAAHKGLNLPGVAVSAPALTPKDEDDLRWALDLGADLVALSFVRHPTDAEAVRRIMREVGSSAPVIAKLEKPQAVDHLDDVIDAFDGVMVARGDLGVELPLEHVPIVQKHAIDIARERSKPVIVATQMLESMVNEPIPTRAEVSDVANAVLDGSDALMLSAETSVGEYPVEAVETMGRIIASVEHDTLHAGATSPRQPATTGEAIARGAIEVGEVIEAAALAAFTHSGTTARLLARYRSPIPLLAFTTTPEVRGQLALTWGVKTFLVDQVAHTDAMIEQVDAALLDVGDVRKGDPVVIVAGTPPGVPGTTNMLRVHCIGDTAPGQR